ncbi:DNA-directed RNA polymerase subunit D, partial [mine drainage metagenome]
TVTSADLLPVGNPDLVPSDLEIPIVKLGPKQAILLTAEAILGRANEHVKWQCTSGVSYKYHREAEILKSKMPEWKQMKEKNPESVLSETKDKIRFTDDIKTRLFSPILGTEGVTIKENPEIFVFRFETDGSLETKEILSYALKRIPERLNALHESIVAAD